jgi:hypothetical protein
MLDLLEPVSDLRVMQLFTCFLLHEVFHRVRALFSDDGKGHPVSSDPITTLKKFSPSW